MTKNHTNKTHQRAGGWTFSIAAFPSYSAVVDTVVLSVVVVVVVVVVVIVVVVGSARPHPFHHSIYR
jgi:hypothetical protein